MRRSRVPSSALAPAAVARDNGECAHEQPRAPAGPPRGAPAPAQPVVPVPAAAAAATEVPVASAVVETSSGAGLPVPDRPLVDAVPANPGCVPLRAAVSDASTAARRGSQGDGVGVRRVFRPPKRVVRQPPALSGKPLAACTGPAVLAGAGGGPRRDAPPSAAGTAVTDDSGGARGGDYGFGGDVGFGPPDGFGGDAGFGHPDGFGGDVGFGPPDGFGGDGSGGCVWSRPPAGCGDAAGNGPRTASTDHESGPCTGGGAGVRAHPDAAAVPPAAGVASDGRARDASGGGAALARGTKRARGVAPTAADRIATSDARRA